jgi:hypothetical protein
MVDRVLNTPPAWSFDQAMMILSLIGLAWEWGEEWAWLLDDDAR